MTSIFALSTGILLLLANILHASERMISSKKEFTKEFNKKMHGIQGQIEELEDMIKKRPSLTIFNADVENLNRITFWAMDEAEYLNTLVQELPEALPAGIREKVQLEYHEDFIQTRVPILRSWCELMKSDFITMKENMSQNHIKDLEYIEDEMMFIESSLIDIQDMMKAQISFAFGFKVRD